MNLNDTTMTDDNGSRKTTFRRVGPNTSVGDITKGFEEPVKNININDNNEDNNSKLKHTRTFSTQSSPIINNHISSNQQFRHNYNRSLNVTPVTASTSSSPLPQLPNNELTYPQTFGYQIYNKSRSPSFSSNLSNSFSNNSRKTPYRVGFQPKGVYRDRTEEFKKERDKHKRSEKDELNDRRLMRRLDKLIELHFSGKTNVNTLINDLRIRCKYF